MALVITSAVITNAGENLFAQVVAGSGAMTITSVQFGSGFPASGDNVPSYTVLKHFVMNGQITGANNLVQSQATIRVNLSSANAPITFQVNEFGVFAQLGAQPVVMIAYGSTGAANGDTVTPSLPSSAIVKDYAILVLFSQAVPSATTVTLQQVVGLHAANHLDNGIDPIPVATNIRTGLLKNTPNNATQVAVGTTPQTWAAVPQVTHTNPGGMPITPLTANTSPFTDANGVVTWQHGLPVITANATLFVATTGNDSTAIINDVTHPWLTIQGAFNYLSGYFLITGITATVSVGPGIFTNPFVVNHPQGSQISVIGTAASAAGTSAAIVLATGVVTITGAAGAFSGFAIGDVVIVNNTQTNPGIEISGCWVVTGNTTTTISYQTGYSSLVTPGNLTGVTSIAVTRLRSQLAFASGTGIMCISNLGLLQNFGVIKTGASAGVGVLASNNVVVGLNGVGFNSWIDATSNSIGAVAQSGAIINCTGCLASDGSYGFLSQLGQINATSCFATSGVNGFAAQSSLMTCSNSFAYGNSADGFSGVNSATIAVSTCASEGNSTGIRATVGSMILQGNGGAFNNNTVTDVVLSITSDYVKTTGTSAAVGTKSANIISNNTLTADGCYYSP